MLAGEGGVVHCQAYYAFGLTLQRWKGVVDGVAAGLPEPCAQAGSQRRIDLAVSPELVTEPKGVYCRTIPSYRKRMCCAIHEIAAFQGAMNARER